MKSMRITWMKSGPATGAGVKAFQMKNLSLTHLLMIKPLVKLEKHSCEASDEEKHQHDLGEMKPRHWRRCCYFLLMAAGDHLSD